MKIFAQWFGSVGLQPGALLLGSYALGALQE